MFELPEFMTLTNQINATLPGKVIQQGCLGNAPHKFVWYNRTHEKFAALIQGKQWGQAYARGRWMFIPVDPGYLLLFGECGGKSLYHPAGVRPPTKYHLCISFEDGSSLSAITQMWGAMELYVQGEERERQYIKDMRPTPLDDTFTYAYFESLCLLFLPDLSAGVVSDAFTSRATNSSTLAHSPQICNRQIS